MSKALVAVTACPSGIAHTYMAAEALARAAKAKGIDMKVETRGQVGVENGLSDEEIRNADAVIIAADLEVDRARFAGKPIITVPVSAAIKDSNRLIEQALAAPAPTGPAVQADLVQQVKEMKAQRAPATGLYKHLMMGVSHMIPFVVAGGIAIAINFAFGLHAADVKGSLAANLLSLGVAAFSLMVPILAGYISYSIADRPGLVPGMLGGLLASQVGAGFLGGIIAGFLAGYVTSWVKRIKLPKTLDSLKPILIIPVITSLITGLLMIYVIGKPIGAIMTGLQGWLTSLNTGSAVVLGLIVGAMMAFDMGGPVNKTAYTFAVGLVASRVYGPMAAVMAAGMTPPLGMALASVLSRKRYTPEERDAAKAATVLGLSFITEGAIPFAAADPFRVIPSIMIGSAVAGALSMAFGATLRAPAGGVFPMAIPGVVGNLGLYCLAIAIGSLVTAVVVNALKPVKA